MKKFKHIPTGKIAVFDAGSYTINKGLEYAEEYVPASIVENGKDWEEVKDKPEWTILSFKSIQNVIVTINSLGRFVYNQAPNGYTLNGLLALPSVWFIHSVRRESDGEVFIIGDIIDSGASKPIPKAIDYFKIVCGEIVAFGNMWSVGYRRWEKIKPKEWEITAFITEKAVCHVSNNEVKLSFGIYSVDECLNGHTKLAKTPLYAHGNPIPIYSVKRLSDCVEFKIGDSFSVEDDELSGKIVSFILSDGEMCITFEEGQTHYLPKLRFLVKKEKLFTTEDGVDIYEGNSYVWVCEKETLAGSHPYTIYKVDACCWNNTTDRFDKKYKVHNFSTKEAAKEFLLMNKPCLSINDILTYHGKDRGIGAPCLSRQELKELAKKKLK